MQQALRRLGVARRLPGPWVAVVALAATAGACESGAGGDATGRLDAVVDGSAPTAEADGGGRLDGGTLADAAAPDAAVPDAAVPDAAVPDAAVPGAAVPDAAVPDAAVPDAAVPDAAGPDTAAPDAAAPDAAAPDAAMPDAAAPDAAVPDACVPVPDHIDGDGDGFGDPATMQLTCEPVGVPVGGDCDDGDPAINPDAEDAWYDGVDSDCAGNSDFDADGDGEDAEAFDGPDCNDAHPGVRQADCGNGTWPEPERTFTLPAVDGQGIYLPDLPERFPEVDWATLERLYIPAGHYSFLRLGGLPERDPDAPLVITNLGGQVRVGGLGHYYLFSITGGAGWVLTGRYDPVARTGDVAFQGHRGQRYANTRDSYGILIDDAFVRDNVSGLAISGGASRFVVEYLEVRHVEFAGLLVKTDNDGDAHMEDVILRDLYVHDVGSEGLYIGSTQGPPQHEIRGLQVYDNRFLRTGTELVQIGQVGAGSVIRNNVLAWGALSWRHAFQRFQDSASQWGPRAGDLTVRDNIVIGAANTLISFFGNWREGDPPPGNVLFERNVFTHTRFLGAYLGGTDPGAGASWTWRQNHFGRSVFTYDQVYGGTPAPASLFRLAGGLDEVPIRFEANVWDGAVDLHSRAADGNGVAGNISGADNVRADVPAIVFEDAALPGGADVFGFETWTAEATLGDGGPVTYPEGFAVQHRGLLYVAARENAGVEPGGDADDGVWIEQPYMADDVRLPPGSPWVGRGLTAVVP